MAPNIKDVAREAGVSVATVSRVINGAKNVNEETRKKVLKAIKNLGYKPFPSLRKAGELSKTIGVMVPNLYGYHYTEILMAIEEKAYNENFEVMVATPKGEVDAERHILDQYFKRKVDGVIVSELHGRVELINQFIKSGIPIVLLDYSLEDVSVDSVNIDNYVSAMTVLKYLYSKGHRKILYLRGLLNLPAGKHRLNAALSFANRHKDVEIYIPDDDVFEPQNAYKAVKNHLQKYGRNFSAVFSFNDWAAIGVYYALKESGLDIPNDISVVGFDDADYSKFLYPSLTTVSQPRAEMGRIATELLIERIVKRKNSIPRNVILPTKLIERDSVRDLNQ